MFEFYVQHVKKKHNTSTINQVTFLNNILNMFVGSFGV